MDDRNLLAEVIEVLGRECCTDDCAVIPFGTDYLVATTDMLHETTDFPAGMTGWQIGWMSVAVTLSDIAGMGAAPVCILLAIGLDREERLRGILTGAKACCDIFGAEISGGDLDHHNELTVVSSGIGLVSGVNRLVRRSGARPGDLIGLTGSPGCAQAALEGYDRHRKALLEPRPRVREGQILGRAGVHAMMDTSDGVALSLYDLLSVNECGFSIHTGSIPVPEGVPQGPGLEMALYGGGDFDLIFTLPPEIHPVNGVDYTVIGEVTRERQVLADGKILGRKGFSHRWDS